MAELPLIEGLANYVTRRSRLTAVDSSKPPPAHIDCDALAGDKHTVGGSEHH